MSPAAGHTVEPRRPATRLLMVIVTILLMAAVFAAEQPVLRLAATTTTDNSGLLQYLLPRFTAATGIEVQTVAVATGHALSLGRRGDVDVVMVHARDDEVRFLAEGEATRREEFMYNDFVLVGPRNDPAEITGLDKPAAALNRIRASGAVFVSRGDDSGTHQRELALWRQTDRMPEGSWYLEVGQGMGKVLQMADQLQAYTLSDRGTWIKLRDSLDLALLFESNESLYNYYSVLPVNPERHPFVHHREAEILVDWLISEAGQLAIDQYRIHGERAFIPSRLTRAVR